MEKSKYGMDLWDGRRRFVLTEEGGGENRSISNALSNSIGNKKKMHEEGESVMQKGIYGVSWRRGTRSYGSKGTKIVSYPQGGKEIPLKRPRRI